MLKQGKKGHLVKEVVLHCAAIKRGQFDRMTAFQVFTTVNRWHRERGFINGFGYHGLIMPSGEFYRGRPYATIGAHVLGHNAGTLGLLLIEQDEIKHVGLFSDWFTSSQDWRLREILKGLRGEHGIDRVTGHNDHANKLCPGFVVKDWLAQAA